MKKFIFSLAVIGTLLNASGSTAANSTPSVEKNEALSFKFKDINGFDIKISETKNGIKFDTIKDKDVILFFYIYDGAPCQKELKIFQEYTQENSNVDVVAVELKGLDREQLKEYAKKKGVTYHMVTGKDASRFVQYIAYRASWKGMVPFILIVDKSGNVKHIQVGAMSKDEIDKIIKK
jgi:peroxiredoxin